MNEAFERKEIDLGDGLKVVVRFLYDNDTDTSWMGRYTDKPGPWTIDRKEGYLLGEWYAGDFIVPEAEYESTWKDNPDMDWSQDEEDEAGYPNGQVRVHLSGYEKLADVASSYERNSFRYFKPEDNYAGESKEDRIKYFLQDWKRVHGLERGDWSFIGIAVELVYKDLVLSGDALWGVESNGGDEYMADTISEILSSLLSEAANKILGRINTLNLASIALDHTSNQQILDTVRNEYLGVVSPALDSQEV